MEGKETTKGKTVRVWNPEKTLPQNLDFTKRDTSTSTADFEDYLKAQNRTPKQLEEGTAPKEVKDLISRIKNSLKL